MPLLRLGFHHLANLPGQSYDTKRARQSVLRGIHANPAICFGMAGFDPKRTPMLNMLALDQQGNCAILTHNSSSSANDDVAKWKTMFG